MNQSVKEKNIEFQKYIDEIDILTTKPTSDKINELIKYKKDDKTVNFEILFKNIKRFEYEQIEKSIESHNYFISKKHIETTSTIMSDNINYVESKKDKNTYISSYQFEKPLKYEQIILNDFYVTFDKSETTRINEPTNIDNIKRIKKIKKNIIIYEYNFFHLNLTYIETRKIENINHVFVSFEIIIRFKNEVYNFLNIKNPIKYVMKLLKPERFSFIEKNVEGFLRRQYLSVVNKFPIFNENKNPSNKLNYIFENKLKYFDISEIIGFKHSITNKLNGVNFFIYYINESNKFYLINQSSLDHLGQNSQNKLGSDFLIQGELYHDLNTNKYTFYIYDVLKVNNDSIINSYHKERLESFKPYYDIFNTELQKLKNISLSYKIFYGIGNDPKNNNYYENLIECLETMKDKNGKIDMEKNDGLIFTPLDHQYENHFTYQYIFPKKLTIDFSVKFIKTENNIYQYDIYVFDIKDKTKLIKFEYENKKYGLICHYDKHPELCAKIKNDDIVECYFDTQQSVFIPYRIRHDKISPSEYKLAQISFKILLNPITLDRLVDLFKDTFNKKQPQQQPQPQQPQSQQNQQDMFLDFLPAISPDNDMEVGKIDIDFIPINNMNITLKSRTNTLIESVLFSVSPEYRGMNYDEKITTLNTANKQFNNDENKLNDINLLSNSFNINIYILEPLKDDKFNIKKRTYNEQYKDNKLYIVEYENYYEVLGYKNNEYNVYIY